NLRKTALQGGFFVYRQQITRRKKGSQEEPLIFFHTWYPTLTHKINTYTDTPLNKRKKTIKNTAKMDC
ncbi:hypothetical protein ACNDVT_005054, partial [Escherichia coli]